MKKRWLFLAVIFAGCGQASYRLHVLFPDEAALSKTARVVVWALSPGGHDCRELMTGAVKPQGLRVLDELEALSPFTEGGKLGQIEAGPVLFFAEGYGRDREILYRACEEISVKAGSSVTVELMLECVCNPERGCEKAAEEIVGDSVDNDCDGKTDECLTDSECNDGNECTMDRCIDNFCSHAAVTDGVACTDDGVFCNGEEKCLSGVCAHGGDPCSGPDGDSDCVESCNEEARDCSSPDPEGSICNDGLWCTVNDRCTSGVCTGQGRDCDDGDFCTEDGCDEDKDTCTHLAAPRPGQEGPYGNATCSNGLDDDCDGLTDDADGDCKACISDASCDDGNVCTTDSCTPDGVCQHVATNEGNLCDDGKWCTQGEVCHDGVCGGGTVRSCSDGDQCTLDVCDEENDRCVNDAAGAEGLPCDDGNPCLIGDTCQNGACVSGNIVPDPDTPQPLTPQNGENTGSVFDPSGKPLRPTFRWKAVSDHGCGWGFSTCDFPSPEINQSGLSTTSFSPGSPLSVSTTPPVGRRYYWRVRACRLWRMLRLECGSLCQRRPAFRRLQWRWLFRCHCGGTLSGRRRYAMKATPLFITARRRGFPRPHLSPWITRQIREVASLASASLPPEM
jgi:hypothetical protein